tara:strand:+ start:880 stop:1578 length:699 start_codon:yes stop_codon:yes gene_type:complete
VEHYVAFECVGEIQIDFGFSILVRKKIMILIGRNVSPFVRRVASLMRLLEIDFEQRFLATADSFDDIAKFNPLGRVPSLVLGNDEILIDSSAIIDYLLEAKDQDGKFLSKTGSGRRLVLRSVAIAHGVMEKGVASSYEKTRRAPEKISEEWLSYLQRQIILGLEELERKAEQSDKWLHGDTLTLADITTICAFDYIDIRHQGLFEPNVFPALQDLSDRGNELSAFSETKPSP